MTTLVENLVQVRGQISFAFAETVDRKFKVRELVLLMNGTADLLQISLLTGTEVPDPEQHAMAYSEPAATDRIMQDGDRLVEYLFDLERVSYQSPLQIILSFPVEIASAGSITAVTLMNIWNRWTELRLKRGTTHAQLALIREVTENLASKGLNPEASQELTNKIKLAVGLLHSIDAVNISQPQEESASTSDGQ